MTKINLCFFLTLVSACEERHLFSLPAMYMYTEQAEQAEQSTTLGKLHSKLLEKSGRENTQRGVSGERISIYERMQRS